MSADGQPEPTPATPLGFFFYAGGAAIGVAGFLAIRTFGQGLEAPPPAPGAAAFGAGPELARADALPKVLLALAVTIVAARAVGAACGRLRQPPVMGEVLAGILLGPSLLGRVAPGVSASIFPPGVAPYLGVLAQIGIILFMFIVGLQLDLTLLRRRSHAIVGISHASIIAPFLLGSALALWLYPRYSSRDVPFTAFALFIGVSLSVTAFPVLARILTDRGMQKTRIGSIALACAAIDDVSAWCLLALVVSVARAGADASWTTIALTVAYVAGMLAVARPLARRLVERHEGARRASQGAIAAVFVAVLLSALATEWIGIHAIFGAFLMGVVLPQDSHLARELVRKLEDPVVVLLLPAFFAFTGLRTEIGLLGGAGQWLACAAIVAVACLGKFGGTLAAARFSGLGWRDSASLGVLMNTRGLMELVVLNVGLDLRVISPSLFAMLVIMAVVTTFATTPILHAISGDHESTLASSPSGTASARSPSG